MKTKGKMYVIQVCVYMHKQLGKLKHFSVYSIMLTELSIILDLFLAVIFTAQLVYERFDFQRTNIENFIVVLIKKQLQM